MAKYKITSIPQKQIGGETNQETEVKNLTQPSYWNAMQSDVDKGTVCPPGKYYYDKTDECLSITEYKLRVSQEMEQDDVKENERKANFVDLINKERDDSKNDKERQFEIASNKYYTDYKNSKKNDSIRPWQSFSSFDADRLVDIVDAEGNKIIDKKTGKPSQEKYIERFKNDFLINKTENGYYEIYPKDIVQDRIMKNGFTESQFKNIWGLDPKQVKEQVGDVIKYAGEVYNNDVQQRIIKTAFEKNMSVEDVIKSLPNSIGTQAGLKNKFEKSTQKIFDDAFTELSNNISSSNAYDKSIAEKDADIFYSNDPIKAYEDKYHKNDLKYLSDKMQRGNKAFSNSMTNFDNSKSNEYLQGPGRFDDAMANQRLANQNNLKGFIVSKAAGAKQNAENLEFNNAFNQYMTNEGNNVSQDLYKKALSKISNDPKARLKLLIDYNKDPNLVNESLMGLIDDDTKQTYGDLYSQNLQRNYEFNKNRGKINSTGNVEPTTADKVRDVLRHPFDAAYYAMSPRETMWDNKSGTYDSRLKNEKKFDVDLGTMPFGPMSVFNYTPLQAANPFKIGFNLKDGYNEGNFMETAADELIDVGTSVGFAKGLNALGNLRYASRMAAGNNLLGSGLKNTIGLKKGLTTVLSGLNNPITNAGFLIQAPENFSNAYDEFQAGNYQDAAINAGLGVLGISPAISGLKTLNSLRKPNTVLTNFNFNNKYTGLYNAATPGSGIGIGNPSINTAQPVFQSVTNPLNKLSKGLGFGEFSVLKQNLKPNNKLLGYQGGGELIKAAKSIAPIFKTSKSILESPRTAPQLILAQTLASFQHPYEDIFIPLNRKQEAPFFNNNETYNIGYDTFNKVKEENRQLLDKYTDIAKYKFGDNIGKKSILMYAAYEESKLLPKIKNQFFENDSFALDYGLENDISPAHKLLGNIYQGDDYSIFNRPDNPLQKYLSEEFEDVIKGTKFNKATQIVRGSQFNRNIPTFRNGILQDINYNDLIEDDVIYPGHYWSATSDNKTLNDFGPKGALINVPIGQSAYRPNMFLDSRFKSEQEIVLPKKLGYKVLENRKDYTSNNPKFTFDIINSYKKGGMTMDLSNDEINKYVKEGYIIEEI